MGKYNQRSRSTQLPFSRPPPVRSRRRQVAFRRGHSLPLKQREGGTEKPQCFDTNLRLGISKLQAAWQHYTAGWPWRKGWALGFEVSWAYFPCCRWVLRTGCRGMRQSLLTKIFVSHTVGRKYRPGRGPDLA